jgi:acetyl-CoA C-acetyltransferase
MLQTAETVAKRYASARAAGRVRRAEPAARGRGGGGRTFDAEIVPITVTMGVADKDTSRIYTKEVTVARDEGIRADTTYEGVAKIKPALPTDAWRAGNASQFSDGAAACVVMSERAAARRGLAPLGVFRGFAVAGCEPDEMGIGPVFAVRKLLAARACASRTSTCGSSTRRSRCR